MSKQFSAMIDSFAKLAYVPTCLVALYLLGKWGEESEKAEIRKLQNENPGKALIQDYKWSGLHGYGRGLVPFWRVETDAEAAARKNSFENVERAVSPEP